MEAGRGGRWPAGGLCRGRPVVTDRPSSIRPPVLGEKISHFQELAPQFEFVSMLEFNMRANQRRDLT
jgi:hypothetical protein